MMLTLKSKNYTVNDLKLLRDVLEAGLSFNTPDCSGNCDNCAMKRVCSDVQCTLHYLDKEIENKLS